MQRRSILRAAGATVAAIAAPTLRAQAVAQRAGAHRRRLSARRRHRHAGARASAKLTQMWGQQVIVENKAGVAGVLAADYVATQPSDGTTLLMAHINSHALAPSLQPKLRYDLERDFVPIVLVGVTPNLLIANPNAQAKTVKDIVALCKAQPGKVSFGSAGVGLGAAPGAGDVQAARQGRRAAHSLQGLGPDADRPDRRPDPVQLRHHDRGHAAREERQGDRDRADAHQARQGPPERADDAGGRLRRLRGHHLVRPGRARARCRARSRRRSTPTSTRCCAMPDVQERSTPTAPKTAAARPRSSTPSCTPRHVKWAKVVKEAGVKGES